MERRDKIDEDSSCVIYTHYVLFNCLNSDN